MCHIIFKYPGSQVQKLEKKSQLTPIGYDSWIFSEQDVFHPTHS